MRNQVVYEANFDFEATYGRLVQSGIAVVEKTEKGLIWVRFKDTKTVFLLSPKGKIQVKWANLEEKKVLLKILKNMLVSVEGQKLTIKPSMQQLFIEYPPPPNFKLYWCEVETEYAKQAEFSPLLKEAVGKVVEEHRLELNFLREPTVKEVAAKVGKTPETMRSILYEIAPNIGWREQDKSEAEKEAEEAINLAGWLKWLEKEETEKLQEVGEMAENEEVRGMDALQIRQIFHQKVEEINMMAEEELEKASNDALTRAKMILKEFPELVPDVYAGEGLNAWPEETKKAWFQVFGSEPPTSVGRVDEGKIIAVIKRLWSILFRPPTVQEIAVETGMPLDSIEKLAYKLAKQTGWFNPAPKLVEDTKEKLGEVLVCAARIRDGKVTGDGKSEDFGYEDEMEIVEEAKRFLKKHPDMLPKLTDDGENVISWPSEALKYLGKIYKPKDRRIPRVWVVPR